LNCSCNDIYVVCFADYNFQMAEISSANSDLVKHCQFLEQEQLLMKVRAAGCCWMLHCFLAYLPMLALSHMLLIGYFVFLSVHYIYYIAPHNITGTNCKI
jgi:hypothetical protein